MHGLSVMPVIQEDIRTQYSENILRNPKNKNSIVNTKLFSATKQRISSLRSVECLDTLGRKLKYVSLFDAISKC